MRNIKQFPITAEEVKAALIRASEKATRTSTGDFLVGGVDSYVLSRLANFLDNNHVAMGKVLLDMEWPSPPER